MKKSNLFPFLMSMLALPALFSCSNKQAKLYENYVKATVLPEKAKDRGFGTNISMSYSCKGADFVKAITYQDSIDHFVKKFFGKEPVSTDTLVKCMDRMKTESERLSVEYDSLAAKYKSMYYSTYGDANDLDKKIECEKKAEDERDDVLFFSRKSDQMARYLKNKTQLVGNLYACKGTETINGGETEKTDTVLFNADKTAILKVIYSKP